MLWGLVTAIIFLGLVWLWRKGMEPAENQIDSPAKAHAVLKFLLSRGMESAEVRFRTKQDPSLGLTFSKYFIRDDGIGFQMVARKEDFGSSFELIRAELQARHVRFAEPSDARADQLRIDFGNDIGLGVWVASLVFEQVYRVRFNRDVIAVFNERVLNFPNPKLTRSAN